MRFFYSILFIGVLLIAPSFAGSCAGPQSDARAFGYTSSSSITTSAANITLPTITNGTIYGVQVCAPSTNSDLIYFATSSATTSSLSIKPGFCECVPLKGATTLSFISATGTQGAQILAFTR